MPELRPDSQILLVDDDEIFASVLARALSRRGYCPVVAHDVDSALAALKSHDPDFAVIDLKLGEESGLSLIPRLKRSKPSLHMIMLTGYSSIATAVSAIKQGAHDYACKPVDADELIALLSGERSSELLAERQSSAPPSIRRLQWEHIQRVLDEQEGNISATARVLGMHRRTLQRMLQKKPVKR